MQSLNSLSAIDLQILATAIELADRYVNSYDVSKPSAIRAATRAELECAMAILKREGLAS